MAKKVWNLMYVAGNPAMFKRVTANADNPMSRAEALASAEKVANNGWRVWVEHHETGERIFESSQERSFRFAEEGERIVKFAVENLPGFVPLQPK